MSGVASDLRQRLTAPGRAEIEIKGSRFLALAFPVATRAEADAMVRALEREHRRATHLWWAVRVPAPESGPGMETVATHDAGEPRGTAGRPILRAIEERALTGVLVLVARTFGGVKLGAGGLKRAYHRAALEALAGTRAPAPPLGRR